MLAPPKKRWEYKRMLVIEQIEEDLASRKDRLFVLFQEELDDLDHRVRFVCGQISAYESVLTYLTLEKE